MERTFWQKLEGTTDQVLAQLRKLVEEGNIRRVVVKTARACLPRSRMMPSTVSVSRISRPSQP